MIQRTVSSEALCFGTVSWSEVDLGSKPRFPDPQGKHD